jgi:5'-deoxynucleotidase YfbR-like HD superfamily hydrolase
MLSLTSGPLAEAIASIPSGVTDICGQTYSFHQILEGHPAPCPKPLAISAGLSAAPRFCGQTIDLYTVAEHSIRVAELSVSIALDWGWDRGGVALAAQCGLLHDAAEAIICDAPAPLKRALRYHAEDLFGGDGYRQVEEALLASILNTYCPDHIYNNPDLAELTKTADRVAFLWECRDFRGAPDYPFLPLDVLRPSGTRREICQMFLHKWEQLDIPGLG